MKTDIEIKALLRVENPDSGNCNPTETKDENPKAEGSSTGKIFLNAWEMSSPRWWPEIFLISCVIGVLIDPLFLYIPVINEVDKCLRRNETMKEIALVLRSITDFAYILHIIVRLQSASKLAKALRRSKLKGLPWSYLLIDILAILPIPQVVVLVFFSKLAGSKSLIARKFLNSLLLAQYVPRILRIYLSAKELARDYNSLTRFVWVRGVFNLCLYIISGHVLGALWYFYSIYWETACWHEAYLELKGHNSDSIFDCHSKLSSETKNVTYFNEFCPVNPTNEKVYDFGLFTKAMESEILLEKTNFPTKFFKCFWWGLRHLSSFGSNLETGVGIWENIFAVIVSISGLVLFLYLIGNLQTYLQFITTKSEEARQKIKAKDPEIRSYLSNHNLSEDKKRFIIKHLRRTITDGKEPDVKNLLSLLEENEDHEDHEQSKSEDSKENKDLEQQKSEAIDKQQNQETFAEWVTKIVDVEKSKKNMSRSAELWITENHVPYDLKKNMMPYLRLRLQEGNKEVDVVNILHILPSSLRTSIKKHLCLDILIKVPMIKTGHEIVCKYLKPVMYSANTYIIRKGEPLDMMFFITQGIVWSFNETSIERLQKGDYFGKELLEWELGNSKSCFTCFPIATKNVKAHTTVEAFALQAANLEQLLNDFEWIFRDFNFLVTTLQRRYRIHRTNKQNEEKDHKGQ